MRVSIENVFSNYVILDDCGAYSPSSTLLDLQSPWKPISGCIHQLVPTKVKRMVRCRLATGSAIPGAARRK